MQLLPTSLPEVFEIRPKVFQDARGFFLETYNREKFVALGIPDVFVQDNHSVSARGTLRGLHYQLQHPQAKLCRVIEGEALDIAVDIRVGSPNFGKWASVLLSAEQKNEIFVPAGFAHGFVALSERVQFLYKCSELYHPKDEQGIIWSDPDLGIPWGISGPLVSDRDTKYSTLAEMPKASLPQYFKK